MVWDATTWAAIGVGGAIALGLLIYFAPARTIVVVDTAASTARADMRLLWGLGPIVSSRVLPRSGAGSPLRVFNDPVRIGHALMTPGLADAAYDAVRQLLRLRPRVARLNLVLNLGDTARNLVVQTAVQAAFAAAPAQWREIVTVHTCDAPGAELAGRFELNASPAQINGVWTRFRDSRPVREFRKRLKRAPKQAKKAPREVRAT